MLDIKKVDPRWNPITGLYAYSLANPGLFTDKDFEEKKRMLKENMQRIENGDVDVILSGSSGGEYPRRRDYLKYYYKCLEPAERYRITVESYVTDDGYNFPRSLIIGLKKIRPADYLKDLPDDLADDSVDTLTVYRATRTPPCGAVKNELSWSISKECSGWFFNNYKRKGTAAYLYCGKIRKDKVIAYTDSREEKEIIQHGGVFGIELLESYRQASA